jgi:hypothetical protein
MQYRLLAIAVAIVLTAILIACAIIFNCLDRLFSRIIFQGVPTVPYESRPPLISVDAIPPAFRGDLLVTLSPSTHVHTYITESKIDPGSCQRTLTFLLHGNSGDIDQIWRFVADDIAQEGVNNIVVTHDYRGCGLSTATPYPSPDVVIGEARTLLDGCIRAFQPTWVVLWGISLGAWVATHMPAADALVLETPFLGTHAILVPGMRWLGERFGAAPLSGSGSVYLLLASEDKIIDNDAVRKRLGNQVTTEIVRSGGHNDSDFKLRRLIAKRVSRQFLATAPVLG